MRSYEYHHVDVFAERVLEGNPLAVFTDPAGLRDAEMQAIALELNLAETVFVQPARSEGSIATLRIFTPRRELAFAGHPTVGAVATLLAERGIGATRFTVDEGVGPVAIRVERGDGGPPLVWLTTPQVTFGEAVTPAAAAAMLGIAEGEVLGIPRYASAGSPFLFVALRDAAAVDRARYVAGLPDGGCPDVVGAFLFTPHHTLAGAEHAVYARMFAPWSGIAEDPATGGATGPLAAYLVREGFLAATPGTRLISEQGVRMGRRSMLHVRLGDDAAAFRGIEVGGVARPLARGRLTLPG